MHNYPPYTLPNPRTAKFTMAASKTLEEMTYTIEDRIQDLAKDLALARSKKTCVNVTPADVKKAAKQLLRK